MISFKFTSLVLSSLLLTGVTSAFVAGDYYDIEVDGPRLVPGEVNCEEEFEEGFVGGIGTAESPYEIDSVEKLQCIAWNNNSAHYELVEDIDASETETWDEGRGFKSISQASRNTFKGVLDGRNHTINNLYINRTDSNTGSAHRAVGLLGNIKDSKIKNIKIENATVRGDSSVGSLVGQAESSKISNIKSNGKIKSLTDAGGIAGELKASNISGTSFSGKVQGEKIGGITADSSGINGLVEKENSKEYMRIRESSINNSKSNATLKGESIGGIARINHGLITNSLFNGQIHLRGDQAGGISVNGGKIKNSYSKAEFTIYAGLSEPEIGGITGNSNSYIHTIGAPTEINNSVSTSEFEFKEGVEPSEKQKIGVIAGKTNSMETNNVYWEENSANIRANSNGDIEKLSTEEIKNSLTALDLGRNWATAKNEYPQLKPFAKGNYTTYKEQKTQESNSKPENNTGTKDVDKLENFNKSTNYINITKKNKQTTENSIKNLIKVIKSIFS